MDPMTRLLIRMAQWFRHPPSPSRIRLILLVLALSAAIVLIERYVGWPDWMSTERMPIRRN
jgi:hypothetical protein